MFINSFYDYVMKEVNKRKDHSYEHLQDSWYLHSSDYLGDLYNQADRDGKENIYLHMLNHQVIDEEFPGYWELAGKIKKDIWPSEKDKRKKKKQWSEEDLIRFINEYRGDGF